MQTKSTPSTWLMAAILSFFALSLTAQEITTEPDFTLLGGPIADMEFEETTYDFGAIDEGTTVTQVFTFTNTSDEPLILSNAKGSCGCTIPQWPREAIQPGETASLTVQFNSKGKRGKRSQRVTLTANTNPPQTFLYLTGEVIPREETDADIPDISADEPKEDLSPDCFAIYPNPTAEILKLEMEESSMGQRAIISIHSKAGQLMARREIDAIVGIIEFNVSHFPPGTYFAQVQIGAQRPETRCFVVVD
ncbi:MAG: DUF1573 domain-containing protein [Alphaproteobacteria bacterium]|nr:DUF1573 domain-containing protein [Alphaproteobacteria bacterium]